jgi:rhodanese-related sulfurtransferase
MKHLAIILMLGSMALAGTFDDIGIKKFNELRAKGVPVIDIRTPAEWQERGIIKDAHKIMFFDERGKPKTKEWFQALSKFYKDKKKPLIIYCAHANRSKTLGKWLASKNGGFSKVYELKGGIEYGWIDKGQAVVK